MQCRIVQRRLDAFSPESVDHHVSLAPERVGIDLDGVYVPRVAGSGETGWHADPRDVVQERVVPVCDLAALGNDLVEPAQLGPAERSLKCSHPMVVTQHGDVVLPEQAGALVGGAGHSVVTQSANPVCQLAVAGQARTALT